MGKVRARVTINELLRPEPQQPGARPPAPRAVCVHGPVPSATGGRGTSFAAHQVDVLRHCSVGELGQIAIRRPIRVMFLEYWGQARATHEKFIGDWRRPGPGIADDDVYIQFVGRDDDVITSAGYRIVPTGSMILILHPAVALAAVIVKPYPVRTRS